KLQPGCILARGGCRVGFCRPDQKYPEGPERFKTCQVLSTTAFSSGQHYWEVDVKGAKRWIVGVACHSIQRKVAGNDSFIGYNNKSWSLFYQNYLGMSHNNVQENIDSDTPPQALGIHLNHDAGQLSFYQLGDTMQHLHTYTASFTEPLHAATPKGPPLGSPVNYQEQVPSLLCSFHQ
uniref:B30.2/SPRY domain-containing protein n=1 Tax=Leptobrachium leishanense TaxID=445787 RepID=A0A8C5PUT2_9ANUR